MRGSGKTHAMVNFAKEYLDHGSFTRVFIISPTYDSNPIFHVLNADKGDVYEDSDHSLKAVEGILKKCKIDSDDYDDYHIYMTAYLLWRKKEPLTLEQKTMLQNNNYDKPPAIPRPSPLLIVDDMSHSDIYSTSRHNPFINLCLRHRHINHGKGITIFLACQTFKSGTSFFVGFFQFFATEKVNKSNSALIRTQILHTTINALSRNALNQL